MKSGLAITLLVTSQLVLLNGCERHSQPTTTERSTETFSISVEIQFSGHAEDRTLELKIPAGTTVFGALKQLTTEDRISAKMTGEGDYGFVSSIGGIAQERGGGSGWTFRVNDELAKVGSDQFELSDGDHVVWRYGRYKPD